MGAEDRNIKPEDYPITIRTALTHDTYVVHGYLESIHALYSMWKMPGIFLTPTSPAVIMMTVGGGMDVVGTDTFISVKTLTRISIVKT